MPYDMVPTVDVIVIKRALKGTAVEVTFALTPKQYAHYQYLIGQCVDEATPLDQNVVGEMQALLEHFR